LNKYDIHNELGVYKSAVHSYNYIHLSIISANHNANGFLLKYATVSHFPGTLFTDNDNYKFSIASVMFKAPVKPNFNSSKDYLISNNSKFIRSISYRATTM